MTDPQTLAYDVVDVFTDPAAPGFSGNQLAVVHGAGHLDDPAMLALAREFGYSETTFPVPAGPAAYDVRIWTPGGEIPFAGHPTLGTAWVLRSRGEAGSGPLVQRCAAGEVGVRFAGEQPDDPVELSATPAPVGRPLPEPVVAALLGLVGLSRSDRLGEARVAGAGLDFVHLPVTEEALVRARVASRPVGDLLGADAPDGELGGINLYASAGAGDPLPVHARVFVPGLGVPEDAATGSAVAGLGVHLVASGVLPTGGRYDVRQGIEMGRPSRLSGSVGVVDGRPDVVRVAGRVRAVAAGRIVVPPGLG